MTIIYKFVSYIRYDIYLSRQNCDTLQNRTLWIWFYRDANIRTAYFLSRSSYFNTSINPESPKFCQRHRLALLSLTISRFVNLLLYQVKPPAASLCIHPCETSNLISRPNSYWCKISPSISEGEFRQIVEDNFGRARISFSDSASEMY